MTYKHAVCGNDLGGGKAVIIGDPATARTEALMLRYAAFVNSLGGRYLTAEDVGTTQADMDLIRSVTPYVTGTSESIGGSGDPSPATAWGVLHALHAVGARLWGDRSLTHSGLTPAYRLVGWPVEQDRREDAAAVAAYVAERGAPLDRVDGPDGRRIDVPVIDVASVAPAALAVRPHEH